MSKKEHLSRTPLHLEVLAKGSRAKKHIPGPTRMERLGSLCILGNHREPVAPISDWQFSMNNMNIIK